MIFGSEAASYLLLAIVTGMFAWARAAQWPRGRQLWASAAVGLGLFAVPAVLVSFSNTRVSATTRVAVFSLVPVFAVVLEPHLSADTRQRGMSGLLGALAAVAGTLCIFPLQLPGSVGAAVALAALVFAAACAAVANCVVVRQARACQARTIAPLAAIAGAAAAVGLAIASVFTERAAFRWDALPPELGRAAAELPGLLLLFWLMRRMTAARMTTRFVLAPLLAVLIGIALEQPSIELRVWVGLLLVAAGAAWLLFAPEEEPDADSASLRL
jgi:drug/metabolite transporter (DMT)-like permease